MSPLSRNTPRSSPEPPAKVDWYDLPEWYDILHAPGTKREVDDLLVLAQRFAPDGLYRKVVASDADTTRTLRTKSNLGRTARTPVWIEPACGTGRYLRVAATRGIRVVGLDLNPNMVRYARSVFPGHAPARLGRFIEADITAFALRTPGDFAFCPINSIRHLPSDAAMLAHLACMAEALRDQGVYAVGMGLTDYREGDSEDVWVGARAGVRVHQLVTYLAPEKHLRRERVLTHLTVSRKQDRTEEHIDSAYDLRTYSRGQWLGLIRRSAMQLVAVTDEQGNDLPEGDSLRVGYAMWILAPRRAGLRRGGRPGARTNRLCAT